MGRNAEVSAVLKNVRPLPLVKRKYPNDYRMKRCVFVVEGTVQRRIDRSEGTWLTVRFKNREEAPAPEEADVDPNDANTNDDVDSEANNDEAPVAEPVPPTFFYIKPSSVRMERPGPPNQYFANDSPANDEQAAPAPEEQDSDPESDAEEEVAQEDDDTIRWQPFADEVLIDERTLPKTKGTLACIPAPEFESPLGYFKMFLPLSYIESNIIVATNKGLRKVLTMAEFWAWLGIWFIISLHPGYPVRDFFDLKERTKYWNPPFLGDIIPRMRFDEILHALRLRSDRPPAFRDKFWWIRELIVAFNANMNEVLFPSWLVTLDESMVVFTNPFSPGWINIKRKPHPFENEYHTIADTETGIIFFIEIVEGRDAPKEGPNAPPLEFEGELKSKIAALCVRMTKNIWGSGRVVLLDSGFGYLPSCTSLLQRGLHSTCVIKKRRHWPANTNGDEVLQEMQGKEVGAVRVRKGRKGNLSFYLSAMADSKHTSILLNTWSTTARMGPIKKRRVGGELKTFQYCEHQHY